LRDSVIESLANAMAGYLDSQILAVLGLISQEADASIHAAVETEGTEADRVRGHARVMDAADRASNGEGPLPLCVEVPIHAGCHASSFQPRDTRPRATMLVEGGIMPEHVERL
jgi:hypothetical protein